MKHFGCKLSKGGQPGRPGKKAGRGKKRVKRKERDKEMEKGKKKNIVFPNASTDKDLMQNCDVGSPESAYSRLPKWFRNKQPPIYLQL